MIALNISNVRSAEAEGTSDGQSHWVTLRFGNNDRATIYTKTRIQAAAVAAALNGEVDASFEQGGVVGA